MQSKLLLGTIGAIVGAVIGAIAWAAITATTNFQIGYMAIGIGFLVGFAMRTFSGGRERIEGIVAGAVALLGCALGNLLAIVVTIGQHDHYPLGGMLLGLARNPLAAVELLRIGFDWMDLLFYAIAAYAAYRTALAPARRAPVPLPVQPAPPPVERPNAS